MSRGKHGKHSELDDLTTAGWHHLVDTVRRLHTVPLTVQSDSEAERERVVASAVDELRLLDHAVVVTGLLMRLRSNETNPEDIKTLSGLLRQAPVSAPGLGGSGTLGVGAGAMGGRAGSPIGGGAGTKRKRVFSVSASPAPAGMADGGAGAGGGLGSRNASPFTGGGGKAGVGSGGVGAGMARQHTARGARKDHGGDAGAAAAAAAAGHPPLQPGRHVAYRPRDESSDSDWVHGIVRDFDTASGLYGVEDVENAQLFTLPRPDIIALPDAKQPTSSPDHPNNLADCPPGSKVLALFPETDAFYRAIVRSAPLPGTGNGLGLRSGVSPGAGALAGSYQVEFEDDEVAVRVVTKDLVVPVSEVLLEKVPEKQDG